MLPADGERDSSMGAGADPAVDAASADGVDADQLRAFRDRLDTVRAARDGRLDHRGVDPPAPAKADGALSMGFRIGTEFVSAVVVGVLIGWAIDRVAGTAPWGMVLLFLLGSAAGFLNVYRATVRMGMAGGDVEARRPERIDRKPVDPSDTVVPGGSAAGGPAAGGFADGPDRRM